MLDKDSIIQSSGLHPKRIFNIYIFGSQVYGTSNSASDIDVIIVANNSVNCLEIKGEKYNIHIYTPQEFQKELDNHNIKMLECLFAPDWAKIKEDLKFTLTINKRRLRHFISRAVSNSWIKAKKKINVENDYKKGIKSLFHSLRMVDFGIQISQSGTIIDFSSSNDIWFQITKRNWTFEELDNHFRSLLNQRMSQFRKLTLK